MVRTRRRLVVETTAARGESNAQIEIFPSVRSKMTFIKSSDLLEERSLEGDIGPVTIPRKVNPLLSGDFAIRVLRPAMFQPHHEGCRRKEWIPGHQSSTSDGLFRVPLVDRPMASKPMFLRNGVGAQKENEVSYGFLGAAIPRRRGAAVSLADQAKIAPNPGKLRHEFGSRIR